MNEQEIQVLQQENEKLKARLNKAIGVFNEQKSTIERLTAERDSSRAQNDELQSRLSEIETQLSQKDEQDTKFFDQLNEINDLEAKLGAANSENKELSSNLSEQKEINENLTNAVDTLNNNINDLNDKYNVLFKGVADVLKQAKAQSEELCATISSLIK